MQCVFDGIGIGYCRRFALPWPKQDFLALALWSHSRAVKVLLAMAVSLTCERCTFVMQDAPPRARRRRSCCRLCPGPDSRSRSRSSFSRSVFGVRLATAPSLAYIRQDGGCCCMRCRSLSPRAEPCEKGALLDGYYSAATRTDTFASCGVMPVYRGRLDRTGT
jgi:hypothetical protein